MQLFELDTRSEALPFLSLPQASSGFLMGPGTACALSLMATSLSWKESLIRGGDVLKVRWAF